MYISIKYTAVFTLSECLLHIILPNTDLNLFINNTAVPKGTANTDIVLITAAYIHIPSLKIYITRIAFIFFINITLLLYRLDLQNYFTTFLQQFHKNLLVYFKYFHSSLIYIKKQSYIKLYYIYAPLNFRKADTDQTSYRNHSIHTPTEDSITNLCHNTPPPSALAKITDDAIKTQIQIRSKYTDELHSR